MSYENKIDEFYVLFFFMIHLPFIKVTLFIYNNYLDIYLYLFIYAVKDI